jgi:ATP synthase protein I
VADDKESPKQDTFDERLNRAQLKARPTPEPDKPDNASNVAFRMGVDLVAGTGVGAFMGYWFDIWFDTKPLFLIALLILGFVAGVRNVVRLAQRVQDADDAGE